MRPETETEVLTAMSAMRDDVTGWTSELYLYIINHLYIVGIIVTVIVIMLLIHTLKIFTYVRKSRKYKIVSTNDWFDWKEFEAYEKKSKSKK